MPTNLYGPNDNFDLTSSHVLPALIRKFHECRGRAATAGDGLGHGLAAAGVFARRRPGRRCLFLLEHYDEDVTINVGTGEDLTIAELAELIRDDRLSEAEIVFDTTMPDGTPRKLLDVSRLHALGWRHRIGLREGIAQTYQWFCDARAARGVGAR